jgi:multidrug efflux system outer membrane protein
MTMQKEAFRSAGIFVRLWVLAAIGLGGCAVGPDYAAPEIRVPATWHSRIEGGLVAEESDPRILASWWTTLDDPDLSRLVDRAVAGNLDLMRAKARIREARAGIRSAKAGFLPTLDATGSATWSRARKDTGTGKSSEVYAAGLDAGWEADIFGGVRRSVEAAEANLQASEEDLRDVLVSLLAETALDYIQVRAYQARISAVEATLKAQEETYQLTVWRNQAGLGDELAIQQARYNLETTRSALPTLRQGLEEALNAIAVLLGEEPGKVHQDLGEPRPIPAPPSKVAVGIPTDVVRRRPDIRRAERELAAQTARIGVAVSELYPKLTLNGSFNAEAFRLSDLSSGLWTVSGGPRLSWAIFNGAVRPNIEIQSALQEQALIAYRSTILNSFREVENALIAYTEEKCRSEALRAGTTAAQEAAALAQHEYQAGLTDFTSVLDAERSFRNLQDQSIQSSAAETSTLIRLYKALGGGWAPTTIAQAPSGN